MVETDKELIERIFDAICNNKMLTIFNRAGNIDHGFNIDECLDRLQKKMAENAQKEVRTAENKNYVRPTAEKIANSNITASHDSPTTFRGECDKILTDVLNLMDKKNKDYGDAFNKMINKYGLPHGISKIEEKASRAYVLLTDKPEFESMEDTLKDIIGYATLTLRYLYNKNRK